MRRLLTLAVLSLILIQRSYASHVMGAEITYKCIASKKYQVTLKTYRDCRGIPLGNPASFTIACASGGTTRAISFSKTSIRDISSRCKTAAAPCNPANTIVSAEGVEEHTYVGIIDFNTTPLSTDLANGCCVFRIAVDECCRNGAINTGSAGNFYVDALIDVCKGPSNSSPVFVNPATMYACCNQPFRYSVGAMDSIDFDSLTYELVAAKEGPSATFSYGGSYSATKPLTPYLPGSPTQVVPTANPPIGFYLNNITGELIFTPTGCTETGPVVVQVNEWRKDSTGTYRKIGEIRRDVQFIIKSCPGNNPPYFAALPSSYTTCESSPVCFSILARDAQFIPPPPITPPKPDSIAITWGGGLPGATLVMDSFTKVSGSLSERYAVFCWTPPPGMARTLAYHFSITATDNSCNPRPSSTTKNFSITVHSGARRATPTYTHGKCGKLYMYATPVDTGAILYSWSFRDLNHSSLPSSIINKNSSTLVNDSVQFYKSGRYVVSFASYAAGKCLSTKYDTLFIETVGISIGGRDTVCSGDTVLLSSHISVGMAPYRYKWSAVPAILATDTLADYLIRPTTNTDVNIIVTDSSGCKGSNSYRIEVPEGFSLGGNRLACLGDTIKLMGPASPFYGKLTWSPGNDTTRILNVLSSGKYSLTVLDSAGCTHKDSALVQITQLPRPDLRDTSICQDSKVTLDAGPYTSVKWNDTLGNRFHTVSKAGKYKVLAMDSLGCKGSDSMILGIFALPDPGLNGLQQVICKGANIQLDPGSFKSYLWNTADTSRAIIVTRAGIYSVVVTDVNLCTAKDSAVIRIDSVQPFSISDSMITLNTYKFRTSLPGNKYTFEWDFGDGFNSGDSTPVHQFAINGNYNVCLTVITPFGCMDSMCISKKVTSLKEYQKNNGVSIYPNPFSDQFTIVFDLEAAAVVEISIVDALGKEYVRQKELIHGGFQTKSIQAELPDGLYFIRIRIAGKESMFKVQKLD